MTLIKKSKFILLMISFLMASSSLYAEDDPKKIILYRKNVMGAVGDHMTGLGRILKGEVSYKHVAMQTQALHLSAQMAGDVFPPGTGPDAGKTRALDNIWTETDKFAKVLKDFQDAAAKLAEAGASGDMAAVGAQMKTLGSTCGSCHKAFRQKR